MAGYIFICDDNDSSATLMKEIYPGSRLINACCSVLTGSNPVKRFQVCRSASHITAFISMCA